MALKSLVFLSQECFVTNKQTHKEVKKIIKSSNNNFLSLVKHFLMTLCFETKNIGSCKVEISLLHSQLRGWVRISELLLTLPPEAVVDPWKCPTPLIFGPKWGLKGQNKFLGGDCPPPLPLSKGLDDHHPPSLISRLGSGLRGGGRIAG